MMSADAPLQLPEEISIANVSEWQSRLQTTLDSSDEIVLDAANLTRVDTSAVQLLAAFVQQSQAQGKSVSWTAHSETLSKTAALLGLEQALLLN